MTGVVVKFSDGSVAVGTDVAWTRKDGVSAEKVDDNINAVAKGVTRFEASYGGKTTEIYIIESIGLRGAERMRDIAQQLGVTLATLTVACDKLEEKGLVMRHRDRNDKRTVHISLTEKGQVAYHFHCSFLSAMAEAMQEGMSPGEREALQRGLEKLNRYFTEKE